MNKYSISVNKLYRGAAKPLGKDWLSAGSQSQTLAPSSAGPYASSRRCGRSRKERVDKKPMVEEPVIRKAVVVLFSERPATGEKRLGSSSSWWPRDERSRLANVDSATTVADGKLIRAAMAWHNLSNSAGLFVTACSKAFRSPSSLRRPLRGWRIPSDRRRAQARPARYHEEFKPPLELKRFW
jgi:hypothetical protein